MHGPEIRGPAYKAYQPPGPGIPVIKGFGHGGTLIPAEPAAEHPSRGDDLVVILRGYDRIGVSVEHIIHLRPDIPQLFVCPGKPIHPFIVGQQLHVHLETRVSDLSDYPLRLSHLSGGYGIEVVRVRVPLVVPAGYGKGVLSPEEFFVVLVSPQGDAHHQIGKSVPWQPDQAVGGAEGGQPAVEGLHPVQAQGGLPAYKDGQVHAPLLLPVDECLPFPEVHLLFCRLVFVGGEEEAPLAAEVAPVCHVVDGTPDIKPGDGLIPAIPFLIQ